MWIYMIEIKFLFELWKIEIMFFFYGNNFFFIERDMYQLFVFFQLVFYVMKLIRYRLIFLSGYKFKD